MSAIVDDIEDKRCDTDSRLSASITTFLESNCQTKFEAMNLGALSGISKKAYCRMCQFLSRSIWKNPLNDGRLQQCPNQELAIGFDNINDNAFILRAKSPNPLLVEPVYLLTTTGPRKKL
jgi:hypothetical protein